MFGDAFVCIFPVVYVKIYLYQARGWNIIYSDIAIGIGHIGKSVIMPKEHYSIKTIVQIVYKGKDTLPGKIIEIVGKLKGGKWKIQTAQKDHTGVQCPVGRAGKNGIRAYAQRLKF